MKKKITLYSTIVAGMLVFTANANESSLSFDVVYEKTNNEVNITENNIQIDYKNILSETLLKVDLGGKCYQIHKQCCLDSEKGSYLYSLNKSPIIVYVQNNRLLAYDYLSGKELNISIEIPNIKFNKDTMEIDLIKQINQLEKIA